MKTFKNFIGGDWVPPIGGEYFENQNPADVSDDDRPLSAVRCGRRREGGRVGAARLRGVARDAGAGARRRAAPHRRPHDEAKGRDRRPHDARDGQAAHRDARRRPGRHRHRVLRRDRRASPLRPHGAERDAEQVGDELPSADRRCRHHHAVQLSDGDSDLEDVSGAALRKRVHLQAGRGRSAHRARARRDHARGGAAARSDSARARPRRDRRRGDREPSARFRSSHLQDRRRRDASSARRAAGCTSGCRSRWAARTR